MAIDIIDLLETMAANGVAPAAGCSLFGVGYEDTFTRLKRTFLDGRLAKRGKSAQKFVVGPFGSGKTHFLRQLMEISRGAEFITSEVTLDNDIDYANRLTIYREVVRNLKLPGNSDHGVKNLLENAAQRVRNRFPDPKAAEAVFQGWVRGIDKVDINLDVFARVLQKAMRSFDEEDEMAFDAACRWLSGNFDGKDLAREVGEPVVSKSEMNLFTGRAMLSLFQFIRYCGFNGTVICYDEADIGFQVNKKKMQTILGMLRADIGAVNDLERGSVFIVYALTPDVVQQMSQYMALQQRITTPPGQGFFDGNDYAALIDLSLTPDRFEELRAIGIRLIDLLYQEQGSSISPSKDEVCKQVENIARDVCEEDITSSSRREMVKRTSALLLSIVNNGLSAAQSEAAAIEDEV
ncbi:MAG: BREX system ATP-binding domain-containing protein [Syntrophomonas sp.]